MTQVVIAVRGGANAKSRCAAVLSPAERDELTAVMLADMLAALSRTRRVAAVWVVTPTPSLGRLAAAAGARVISQSAPGGLNPAFRLALAEIADRAPYAATALLPGDLPLLMPNELEAAIALSRSHQVVLAPSRDGGTGALLLRAAPTLEPAFGVDSFARHTAAARRQGLSLGVIKATSLSLDADQPEDLLAIIDQGPQTGTAAFLRERLRPSAAFSRF
jgi:2-phospho-L-lactate guanylyltransferase